MAAKKISQLSNLGAAPAATDTIPIVDSSASSTKKVTVGDLFTGPTFTGQVGIGESAPEANLHVKNASAGTFTASSSQVLIENNTTVRLSMVSPATNACSIEFGDVNDQNVGVITYDHASDFMKFGVNASEAMRIDSSGNVGIGATAPGAKLDLSGTNRMQLRTNDSFPEIRSMNTTGSAFKELGLNGLDLRFLISNTEKARLDTNGNLLVGKSSADFTAAGHEIKPGGFAGFTRDGGAAIIANRLTSDGNVVEFYKGTTSVGNISVTSSATAYNTSSDQRLKDNIVDAPSASDDIDAIQVRSFDWKADGKHQKYGMVAQELQSVAPEAVSGDADSDDMMGVDYSKLVPMLVKEIQSLRARVAQLETN